MILWPWTNLQSLNLDWIVRKMRGLEDQLNTWLETLSTNTTASAATLAPGSQVSVTVDGNLESGLDFTFRIPQGAPGADGVNGQSFRIRGIVATTSDLPASPAIGDAYAVGTSASNTTYCWNGTAWQDIGPAQQLQAYYGTMTPGTGLSISDFYSLDICKSGNDLDIVMEFYPAADRLSEETILYYEWDGNIPHISSYNRYNNMRLPIVVTNSDKTMNRIAFVTLKVDSTKITIEVGKGETFERTKHFWLSTHLAG